MSRRSAQRQYVGVVRDARSGQFGGKKRLALLARRKQVAQDPRAGRQGRRKDVAGCLNYESYSIFRFFSDDKTPQTTGRPQTGVNTEAGENVLFAKVAVSA